MANKFESPESNNAEFQPISKIIQNREPRINGGMYVQGKAEARTLLPAYIYGSLHLADSSSRYGQVISLSSSDLAARKLLCPMGMGRSNLTRNPAAVQHYPGDLPFELQKKDQYS
ncbi:hypothetical protein I7I51_01690 [Histoplasma capsulatum]|uniref:Uncharacterized protein n=1 Tax=Ajellomyces capsulatus TaxID=5037 RepID=A0A8A1MFC9_AJECA|nr:hypothetical protein I7I51_01690 [Histoplasma capsulatum]